MDAQEQRRLLELAAKAANVDFYTPEGMDTPWCGRGFYLRGCVVWNPLDDDGDALRLAVKLGMDIDVCPVTNLTWAMASNGDGLGSTEYHRESDPYAATRLAIVRAAAAIWEKMEEEK